MPVHNAEVSAVELLCSHVPYHMDIHEDPMEKTGPAIAVFRKQIAVSDIEDFKKEAQEHFLNTAIAGSVAPLDPHGCPSDSSLTLCALFARPSCWRYFVGQQDAHDEDGTWETYIINYNQPQYLLCHSVE